MNPIVDVFLTASYQTLYMVAVASILAVILGFFPAVILVVTDKNGLSPNKYIFGIIDFVINILRSFPFIILMIAIFPLTQAIVGNTIGSTAAIVPITIAASPFAARLIESALREVDLGVIEAARSFGASSSQIILRVMLKEAMPSIILGITLLIINVVGCSAMAGAIGGGGLGNVAIEYGYYRFQTDIMIYTVIILMFLVQIIQMTGNLIYKKLIK
jgi:D-methionine transport system permease protein